MPSLRSRPDTLPPPAPQRPRSSLTSAGSLRRRRHRLASKRRPPKLTWQSASFHLSLVTTWIVIAFLWSIVPAAFVYVLYTVLTAAVPALHPYRPAPRHVALEVVHYIFLAYCALEIPFSITYRLLARRQQRLRPPLRHSRKHLRGLILRSLENGLTLEQELEHEIQHEHAHEHEHEPAAEAKESQVWVEHTSEGTGSRQRPNRLRGDGAATPELATTDLATEANTDYLTARSQLPTLRTDDLPGSIHLHASRSRSTLGSPLEHEHDEGFAGSRVSLDSAFASSPRKKPPRASYPPHRAIANQHDPAPVKGFIDPPLSARDPRAIDFRNYLRYWFAGCEFLEIRKLNMADWLAWSLYGTTLEHLERERKEWDQAGRPVLTLADGTLDEDDSDEIDEDSAIEGDKYGLVMHCVELVEARAAHRFEPGRNDAIQTLRLTLDPVRVTQRPLILYLFVAALQNGVLAATKLKGFKEIRDGNVKYLCRVPKDWVPDRDGDESTRPLVFIHGLGMGSAQYATFMSYLCSHRSFRKRPILVLLQPHISMSFFERGYHDPPDQVTLTHSIERMMKRLKFDEAGGATVLSHSNGTIVHAWLVKHAPTLCARNCFVDAVCFCLWEPFVCYNFLYSKPKTPIEYLMRYFVSRELGIAVMLSRTFEWTSNLLFPCEIPNVSDPSKSAVFLASNDSILNAERVKTYLERNGFQKETNDRQQFGITRNTTSRDGDGGGGRLKVFQGLKHGQSMIGEGDAFEEIMEWICQATKGTLAPGTASPTSSVPPSNANSGAESEGGGVGSVHSATIRN
ncbi:uncharacterized protein JCM15063_005790 [Sporobolomyces koalae]|uniref:uncharacterized protein n=1 Tax=Sporobolomyces koalae TaxID=500713 RepID=UPI00316F8770